MPESSTCDWEKVTAHAAWAPRDSCGEVVHADRMWLLGGWFDSYSIGPRDVWSSADGAVWTETVHTAGWKHGDLPTSLVHAGRMWMLGGWYGGRLPEASASHEVWSSSEGVHWECAAEHAGWTPRLGAAGVSFRDKLWIFGGVERYFDGEPRHLRNDVWCSSDGVRWELVAEAPWAARAYYAALIFQDRIWICGGGNYLPVYQGFHDVWSSADGVHWTEVTAHAPWHPRIWFSAVVYRGCMWILGGWSNNPSRNWNDVWYTRDGANWHELKTPTIWSERHEHSAYVFDDKLWIAGGNAWPLVNDVWRLQLPEDWQPES